MWGGSVSISTDIRGLQFPSISNLWDLISKLSDGVCPDSSTQSASVRSRLIRTHIHCILEIVKQARKKPVVLCKSPTMGRYPPVSPLSAVSSQDFTEYYQVYNQLQLSTRVTSQWLKFSQIFPSVTNCQSSCRQARPSVWLLLSGMLVLLRVLELQRPGQLPDCNAWYCLWVNEYFYRCSLCSKASTLSQ